MDEDRVTSAVYRSAMIVLVVWAISAAAGVWAGYQWGQATAYDEILGPWR